MPYDPRMKEYRLQKLLAQPGFTFLRADIAEKAILESPLLDGVKFTAIIHLAARAGVRYSVENPWVFLESNVIGTLNMLEVARRSGNCKFILASTLQHLRQRQPALPHARNRHPAASRFSPMPPARKALKCWRTVTTTCTASIRPSCASSPSMARPAAPTWRSSASCSWILEDRPVRIYGDGTQSRGFTYIDDIVRGILAALQPMGYEIINLGGHEVITINGLVTLIEDLTWQKSHRAIRPAQPGGYVHQSGPMSPKPAACSASAGIRHAPRHTATD